MHFLFTCNPDSHPTLYRWVNLLQGPDLGTLKTCLKVGSQYHAYAYRYANQVPLARGQGALKVNWCELTVTDPNGQVLCQKACFTDWTLEQNNVAAVAASARAPRKIENQNNNTLKTKGYHLEQNFGHGKKHLAALLVTLNPLAFLFHTVLELTDAH